MVFSSNSNDLTLARAAARTGPATAFAPRVAVAAADRVNAGRAWVAAAAAPVYAPYRRKVRRSIPRFSVGSDRSSMASPFAQEGRIVRPNGALGEIGIHQDKQTQLRAQPVLP